jgi:hypothetical protein
MRFLLTVMFLVFSGHLFADRFIVLSPLKKDPKDARTFLKKVKDQNGELCALIKIRTDIQDIQISSMPDPEEIVAEDGEYFVYLSAQSKRLILKKPGFMAFEYTFPEPIMTGLAYVLEITHEDKGSISSDMGFVSIMTQPEKANIRFLEFRNRKTTITQYNNKVSPYDSKSVGEPYTVGTYRLKIEMEYFETIDTLIKVFKDSVSVLDVSMQKRMGYLTVNDSSGDARGAEVILNGMRLDYVPFDSKPVQEGKYKIVVKKNGFVTLSDSITIRKGEAATFAAQLEQTVRTGITSNPEGAEIVLDAHKKNFKTPMELDLRLGTHHVTLKKYGYAPMETSFEVIEGKSTYHFDMIKDGKVKAFKKLIINRTLFFGSAGMVLGGLSYSAYLAYSNARKYDEYKTATYNAGRLHEEIIANRKALYASLGVAAVSLVPFYIAKMHFEESGRNYRSLSLVPVINGAVVTFNCNF